MNIIFEGPVPHFDGAGYDPAIDHQRLTGQLQAIFGLMKDGEWRTLQQIEQATRYPTPSISAQLRHLRKPRFGSHTVERRRIDRDRGLWEYRLIVNQQNVNNEHPSTMA